MKPNHQDQPWDEYLLFQAIKHSYHEDSRNSQTLRKLECFEATAAADNSRNTKILAEAAKCNAQPQSKIQEINEAHSVPPSPYASRKSPGLGAI